MDVSVLLTPEEKDLLEKHELNYMVVGEHGVLTDRMDVTQYDKLARKLNELNSKTQWSSRNESDFMDKCREINNRLHGIYNKQDKVAFQ